MKIGNPLLYNDLKDLCDFTALQLNRYLGWNIQNKIPSSPLVITPINAWFYFDRLYPFD